MNQEALHRFARHLRKSFIAGLLVSLAVMLLVLALEGRPYIAAVLSFPLLLFFSVALVVSCSHTCVGPPLCRFFPLTDRTLLEPVLPMS